MATVFETPSEMLNLREHPLGASDWILVDQERINGFAEATGDKQWIHVDPERASTGPFGATIAHGYLTLALVNMFLPQIVEIRGTSMGVNVGCASVKFLAPVRVGARIRGSGILVEASLKQGNAVQSIVRVTVEIEGETKPACIVDTISRYFPLAT